MSEEEEGPKVPIWESREVLAFRARQKLLEKERESLLVPITECPFCQSPVVTDMVYTVTFYELDCEKIGEGCSLPDGEQPDDVCVQKTPVATCRDGCGEFEKLHVTWQDEKGFVLDPTRGVP